MLPQQEATGGEKCLPGPCMKRPTGCTDAGGGEGAASHVPYAHYSGIPDTLQQGAAAVPAKEKRDTAGAGLKRDQSFGRCEKELCRHLLLSWMLWRLRENIDLTSCPTASYEGTER